MGQKYVSIAQSGYNVLAPPDDGTQVAANVEKWSDVKTKIGDPVLTLAQDINSALINTLDFSGRTASTTDTSLASDHMKTIECTGTFTASLLDAVVAASGYIVSYRNIGSGLVSVNLQNSANTLDGTVNGTTTIPPNGWAAFKVNMSSTGYISYGANTIDTHNSTSKATPVDADELPMADSAASFGLKKLTWANLKATLATTLGYTPAGTGAVTTTVQVGLRAIPITSIENFNPTPTVPFGNSQDIYAATTLALAASRNVYIPNGAHTLTAPILFAGHKIFGAAPGYTGAGYSNKATLIVPSVGIAAFAYDNSAGFVSGGCISDLQIDWAAAVPSNAAQIGINMGSASYFPSFMEIRDVRITGAYYGIKDIKGAFEINVTRVHAEYCRMGFIKQYGTTTTYKNCYASYCYGAYKADTSIAVVYNNCAFDYCNSSTDASPLFWAIATKGLVVNGMDQEANTLTSPGIGIVQIDNCKGFVVNGMATVSNSINNPASEGYWINVIGGSVGTINGVNSATLAYGYAGGSTVCQAVSVSGTGTTVKLTGCNLPAIIQNYAPSAAYSLVNTGTGEVSYENCVTGDLVSIANTAKTWVPAITDSAAAGVASYTTVLGGYSWTGRVCTFKAQIVLSNYTSTGANQAYISLPFAPNATASSGDYIPVNIVSTGLTLAANTQVVGLLKTGTDKILLYTLTLTTGTLTALFTNNAGFTTSAYYVSGTYLTK